MEPSYEDLLDEAMSAFDEPECGAEGMDVGQADKFGWALRAIERKRVNLTTAYEERRAMLDDVYNKQREQLDAQTERLETMLCQWLLAWNAGDSSKKSHTLPCGVKVSSTAGSIEMVVEDADKFEAWVAENMPEKVETTTKVKTGEVKKALVSVNTEDTKHDGKVLKLTDVVVSPDGDKVPGVALSKKPRTVKVSL